MMYVPEGVAQGRQQTSEVDQHPCLTPNLPFGTPLANLRVQESADLEVDPMNSSFTFHEPLANYRDKLRLSYSPNL